MKKSKISINYVVLSCPKDNEKVVVSLLQYLSKNKDTNDNILLLFDGSEDNVPSCYKKYAQPFCHKLDYSYSEHRNYILGFLKNDYSLFLDSDERIPKELIYNIKDIISNNDYPDLINLPRINIVEGLTQEAAKQYGWSVTDNNIIQWEQGDYQTRLFKNGIGLKWTGNLHERIYTGKNNTVYTLMRLPQNAIIHRKTLEVQLKGNEDYKSKYTLSENQGKHIC
jgi:hypothetical protein